MGGTLHGGLETISNKGTAIFTQTGGANDCSSMHIGSQGTYELKGGSLTIPEDMIVKDPGGKFLKTGSDFQAGNITNAGQIILAGTGTAKVTGTTENLPGGLIHVNGNPASFQGDVTNQGTFKITNTIATFGGNYIEKGTFISQEGTQYFTSLLVTAEGVFQATANSRFVFSHDLAILSTCRSEWDTAKAELIFIPPGWINADMENPMPGEHLLTVAGQDFAWRRLFLGDEQTLILADGDTTPGGSLYLGEIMGLMFDEYHVITNIVSDGINLFYDPNDPLNSYLGRERYLLTGSGYLAPAVPLPASWLLLCSGFFGLVALKSFRQENSPS
jgi:hypothetical protein